MEPIGLLVVAAPVAPQKLVILILGQIIVKISVDGVEHLIDDIFLQTAFKSHNGFHELLFADLALIVMIGHSEDITKGHTHIFGFLVQILYDVDHIVYGCFMLNF